MDSLQTILILMFAAVLLIGIAQRLHVPYPITLVLGGAAIGFIPVLPVINFDPNLILFIVLPPILYYAAFGISFREFKLNWRSIFSLALGLVVFTTFVIGIIFKWMFPEFSWALAFTFGAIVSPPDAISATTILKRFAISPRLVTLLEGESLVNDASAIVLYKLSLSALLMGTFSIMEGALEFVQAVGGGILVGLVSGILLQLFSRRYLDPVTGVVFSFTIPYITYLCASFLEVSGVLAVVVNGLIGARILFLHHSSLRRIVGYAAWDIFMIFLNCFVFVLIGLQLRKLTGLMAEREIVLYTGYAFLIFVVMVMVRMFWVYAIAGISHLKNSKTSQSSSFNPQFFREATIIGCSGMRGIVSLVIALALPFTLPNGHSLEGRNVVIFMTFVVILLTLLIPGLTLPRLINLLKIRRHSKKEEERKIRHALVKVSEEKIHQLFDSNLINQKECTFLKEYFSSQFRVLEMSHETESVRENFEVARLDVIQSQRKKLREVWELQDADDKLLTHLEGELDMLEVHIARAEIK